MNGPSRDPTMNAVNKSPSVIALMDFLRPSANSSSEDDWLCGIPCLSAAPLTLTPTDSSHSPLSIRSAATRNFQTIVSVRASPAESEASWSWLGTEVA